MDNSKEQPMEKNGIIAEFMGFKKGNEHSNWKHKTAYSNTFYYSEDGNRQFQEGSMKYHSSWDWLMPVVEKIRTLNVVNSRFLHNCLINYSLEKVYQEVIGFINWYNQSNHEPN